MLPEVRPHIIGSNESTRKNGNHEWNEDVRHPGHAKSRIKEAGNRKSWFFLVIYEKTL